MTLSVSHTVMPIKTHIPPTETKFTEFNLKKYRPLCGRFSDAPKAISLHDLIQQHLQKINATNNPPPIGDEAQAHFYKTGVWRSVKHFNYLTEEEQKDFREQEYIEGYTEAKSIKRHTKVIPCRDLGHVTRYTFELQKGFTPSQALDDLKYGPSYLNDRKARGLAILIGLRDYLKSEKFDAIFASDSPIPLMLDDDLSILSRLIQNIPISPSNDLEDGDLLNIDNIGLYRWKHPLGDMDSLNPIVRIKELQGLYFGFGLPYKGATEEELEEICYQAYNDKPLSINQLLKPENIDPKEQERALPLEDSVISKELFLDVGGGIMPMKIQRFDMVRINLLKLCEVSKIQQLFQKFRPHGIRQKT